MNNVLQVLKRGVLRRSVARWLKESPLLRYVRLVQPDTRLWGREPGTLPSVLIIGAQRSGSTFLHDTLVQRTSARRSPLQKEVHYFDNKYYRSLSWYAKFFATADGNATKNFEASPYYLYHPAVPRRVKESLGSVKVVAVLRDPVERAVSQYKWIREVGLETREAEEAFRYDAKRLDWEKDPEYLERFADPLYFDFDHIHRGYLRRSLYDIQLRRWLHHFDSSRIRVLESSCLFNQTAAAVSKLAEFLGLEQGAGANKVSINQNSSRDDVEVSAAARRIAERHLQKVPERTEALLADEMIVGERPLLES